MLERDRKREIGTYLKCIFNLKLKLHINYVIGFRLWIFHTTLNVAGVSEI